ncbi:transthyretin-like family domain-containing protein [Ditylenchus destructor]|nr:transthyretin-like family domain-containing protein [Ditylenchus destructor]
MAAHKILIYSALFFHFSSTLFGEEQTVTVTGQIFCADSTAIPDVRKIGDEVFTLPRGMMKPSEFFPFKGARVRLMESDLFADDVLARDMTGVFGGFKVSGKESEIGDIEPYLIIQYEGCEHVLAPKTGCTYVRKISLPQTARDSSYKDVIIVVGSGNSYDEIKC